MGLQGLLDDFLIAAAGTQRRQPPVESALQPVCFAVLFGENQVIACRSQRAGVENQTFFRFRPHLLGNHRLTDHRIHWKKIYPVEQQPAEIRQVRSGDVGPYLTTFNDGLGESNSGVAALLEMRYALSQDWRYFLDARVQAGEIGTLGLFGAGTCLGCQPDGTGGEVGAVVTFHDSKLANRDFGVTARQSSNSGLPETEVDSGYRSTGFNVNYRTNVNEHWQMFGEALYEIYGSDVSDSPISRNDYEAEVGVGFIYVF